MGSAASLGIHESQSRLWENQVGRDKPFWEHFYPRLQQTFPATLDDVPLDYRFELYGAGKPIPFVYFPVTGVASIVNTMMDGSAAEVGTVGNEGIVGLPIILGDTVAPNDVYVQVPGSALRMPAARKKRAPFSKSSRDGRPTSSSSPR